MNKSSFKVCDIGEKELIKRIITKTNECSIFHYKDANNFNQFDFKTQIGDDCGLVDCKIDDEYLVTTCDLLIQSTHFPKAMTYYQMGYKSIVVNVSDLAAMGAEPIGFLLSLAIPSDMLLDDFDDFVCGITQASNQYNIPLIGGDTNEAKEVIVSITAIGKVNKDKPLMKYGFNQGDLVAITGDLGLAALGFELLADDEKLEIARKIDSSYTDLAIFKALKVEARLQESFVLNKFNNIELFDKESQKSFKSNISATDITDGLASELYELLEADIKYHQNLDFNSNYNKSIRIYEEKLNIDEEFKEISKAIGLNYLDLFFHVGEDFELLFTFNKELYEDLSKELDFIVIGEIIEKDLSLNRLENSQENPKNFTLEMVDLNGKSYILSSKGYEHLRG